MSISINTNLSASTARRHISRTDREMNKRLKSMASALRINQAADDAAGMAISEGMRSRERGSSQAIRNLQDGVSMIQTAEGGAAQVQSNLQRMRELSLQSANDTMGPQEREAIQAEVSQLSEEINRLTDTVQFNDKQLLSGDISSESGGAVLHAGASRDETVTLEVEAMDTETLDVADIDVTTREGANQALEMLSGAINQVSTERAGMGSVQNRIEGTIDFLQIQRENQLASESQIRDADLAAESTELATQRVLTQSGTAVLGQANNLHSSSAMNLLG
ncbi:MAG: flagellin [bacterium]